MGDQNQAERGQRYPVGACGTKSHTVKERDNEEAMALAQGTCAKSRAFFFLSEKRDTARLGLGFAKEARAKPKLPKACSRTTEGSLTRGVTASPHLTGLPRAPCGLLPYLPTAPALVA